MKANLRRITPSSRADRQRLSLTPAASMVRGPARPESRRRRSIDEEPRRSCTSSRLVVERHLGLIDSSHASFLSSTPVGVGNRSTGRALFQITTGVTNMMLYREVDGRMRLQALVEHINLTSRLVDTCRPACLR